MKTKLHIIILLAVFLAGCGGAGSMISQLFDYPVTEQFSFNLPAGEKYLSVTNMSASNAKLEYDFSFAQARAQVLARAKMNIASMGFSHNDGRIIKDMDAASRFNANPPPRPAVSGPRLLRAGPASASYIVGESKSEGGFWVENNTGNFVRQSAAVRAKGSSCYIWVAGAIYTTSTSSDSDKLITSSQAQDLADKFDIIYPLCTNLLGYEYGGGLGGSGGIDGDKEIHIFVYDAGGSETGLAGYFWAKDEYPQDYLDKMGLVNSNYKGLKSNQMEIFYIDAYFLDKKPETIYSTLIHEFQHMINFNRKSMEQNLASETWYNEMLSMLAEDVIAPFIGIGPGNPGHVINERIPLFLDLYWYCGVDEWLDGDDKIISYSTAYAFGAYLIRNFGGSVGGPGLIYEILNNKAVNHASITQALQKVNNNASFTFDYALEHYAEALVYSTSHGGIPAGKMSFEKPSTSNISGKIYTAYAFDIWTTNNDPRYGYDPRSGPYIHELYYWVEAPRRSVWVHDLTKYFGANTGTLSGTITKPSSAVIKMNILGY